MKARLEGLAAKLNPTRQGPHVDDEADVQKNSAGLREGAGSQDGGGDYCLMAMAI